MLKFTSKYNLNGSFKCRPIRACIYTCMGLFSLLISQSSCDHPQITPSFYYWKTTFHLTSIEKKYLNDLTIKKLYLRLFDVSWDKTFQSPIPAGTITFKDSVSSTLAIVPVVYISNEAMLNIRTDAIQELSDHIFQKISAICRCHHIRYNEIQLDCDWSDKSGQKYFDLLRRLTKKLSTGQFLSATIRLHQVKYCHITGIPPVKRGMLMFYNMGKISPRHDHNSIYNDHDAGLYTQTIKRYPLPLDVALPAFSWGVHLREGQVIGLLNNFTTADLKNNQTFESVSPNYYRAKSAFFFHGYYFMPDDQIKIEETTPELSLAAAGHISSNLKPEARTVSIFHCDSLIFTRYEKSQFEKIYHYFR